MYSLYRDLDLIVCRSHYGVNNVDTDVTLKSNIIITELWVEKLKYQYAWLLSL